MMTATRMAGACAIVAFNDFVVEGFMKRRGVRLTVFVLFLAALGGAAYGVWTFETRMAADREARARGAQRTAEAVIAIGDLRAAQQAYVAAGQNESFWSDRVTTGAQAVRTAIDELRAAAAVEAAWTALDQAASVMRDFDQIDRRAREHLAVNQPLLASDLIFADGLEMLRAAGARLDEARQAQDAVLAARLNTQRTNEAAIILGALGLTLFVTLLLLPSGGRTEAAADAAPAMGLGLEPGAQQSDLDDSLGAALDARLAGAPLRPEASRLRSATASRAEAAGAEAGGHAGARRGIDLRATAELCTDLSRIANTADLPSMLARAARLLDASGIVLWIADPAGHDLLPSIAHGYPAQAISRLGRLHRDSDNATAAAFRSGRLQVVGSEPGQTGAIIAPLLGVSGCMGVMAVEVRNQGEEDEGVRAAAGIIAAQLASLVSAAPAAAGAPAEPKTSAG
jgi:hypothetical protein